MRERYLRAVKNRFQAHRIIRVAGEDLVFHVDFLNERIPGDEIDLVGGQGRLQSIYTPAMQAVFKYAEFRAHAGLTGVRFPSVETFIVSKAAAALVKKRHRDAFDMFLTAADQETLRLHSRWGSLMGDGLFRDANDALWTAIHDGDAVRKIGSVLDEIVPEKRPSDAEIRAAFDFLVEPDRSGTV